MKRSDRGRRESWRELGLCIPEGGGSEVGGGGGRERWRDSGLRIPKGEVKDTNHNTGGYSGESTQGLPEVRG